MGISDAIRGGIAERTQCLSCVKVWNAARLSEGRHRYVRRPGESRIGRRSEVNVELPEVQRIAPEVYVVIWRAPWRSCRAIQVRRQQACETGAMLEANLSGGSTRPPCPSVLGARSCACSTV